MSLASNVGFIDSDKVDLADKLHLLVWTFEGERYASKECTYKASLGYIFNASVCNVNI